MQPLTARFKPVSKDSALAGSGVPQTAGFASGSLSMFKSLAETPSILALASITSGSAMATMHSDHSVCARARHKSGPIPAGSPAVITRGLRFVGITRLRLARMKTFGQVDQMRMSTNASSRILRIQSSVSSSSLPFLTRCMQLLCLISSVLS